MPSKSSSKTRQSHQSTLMTHRTHKRSRSNICPVSDTSIGIITDNDHRNGLCLCRFCDCGWHVCPFDPSPELFLKSTFKTNYQDNYKISGFDVPLRPIHKLYHPNKADHYLMTTNQEFYIPHLIKPQTALEKPKYEKKGDFNAKTTHMDEFRD